MQLVWVNGSDVAQEHNQLAEVIEATESQFKVRLHDNSSEHYVPASAIIGFEFSLKVGEQIAVSYRQPPDRITITSKVT